jgi:hypothetical protein
MSWQHCQTDELASELVDSSANVDCIGHHQLASATFLPSGRNSVPVDILMT